MYGFVDTIDSEVIGARPSEAMQVNGQYVEDMVAGYRTLSVSGRELLGAEVDVLTKGMAAGGRFIRKRLNPRLLNVRYQLIANSNEDFREAFNHLNRALAVEEAILVFDDELDKHFIGTPGSAWKVPEGVNSIISEFEIVCAQPWKFGEEVREGVNFTNPGSCEAPCLIRVTFGANTRDYVASHSQQGRLIRVIWDFSVGDILEIDTGRRLVTINGNTRMTALDFRRPMFSIQPGRNTLETSVNEGWTEIAFRPRWL